MKAFIVRKIGCHRGNPRLWLQGRVPHHAGFTPHKRFTVQVDEGAMRITLSLTEDGERKVSLKEKNGKVVPIVDINSSVDLAMFEGIGEVRVIVREGSIEVMPLETAQRMKRRLNRVQAKLRAGIPLDVGSFSHGGGILSKALHDGMRSVGVATHLKFANDIREDLLEHAAENNPVWTDKTVMLAAPMQELVFDQVAMSLLGECDILEAGIPCSGASVSGRAKNATACAEAHPEVGHLVVAFLALIARVNPAAIVLENVPPYQSSSSMWIIRNQLRDLGYVVHEEVLAGKDWNTLDQRRRLCMVAFTQGMDYSMDMLVRPAPEAIRLGDALEQVPLDDPSWSTMTGLKDKAVRDLAAGKNFQMQVVDADSTWVRSPGKGYSRNRSTEPKVQHPENPELLRLFTPNEHAAIKGNDPQLISGTSFKMAHEILGQGVNSRVFESVGAAVGHALRKSVGLVVATVPMRLVSTPAEVVKKIMQMPAGQPKQLALI